MYGSNSQPPSAASRMEFVGVCHLMTQVPKIGLEVGSEYVACERKKIRKNGHYSCLGALVKLRNVDLIEVRNGYCAVGK